MTSAVFNYFLRADITLATYTAGAKSTITVSCVNKPLKDSSSVATYWPILESVGEVNLQAGEVLPTVSVGSITLRNDIGSFGADRKFSDLLQRYTPTDQDVTVYVGASANDSDTVSSWTQVAKVKSATWEHAANGATLSISITPFRFDEKVLTLDVAQTVSGMENAPTSSLGRAVPLLVGTSLDVLPIRITADGATTARYAVGTCLYQHLKNVTSSAVVYTKNFMDEWEPVENVLSIYEDSSASVSAGTYTLNTYAERVVNFGQGARVLVTGVKLYARGNGLAVSTARLKVTLYRADIYTNNIIEEVTSGLLDLANYNSQNAASTTSFEVKISFDQPAFLSNYDDSGGVRYQYALGFSVTDYQAGDLSLHYTSLALSGWVRDTADSAQGFEFLYVSSMNALKMQLQTVTIAYTDHVSTFTASGLTYTQLQISQFSPDTGQSNPALDSLPIMVTGMQGLSTYAGGTVSYKPNELGGYLSYVWSGSAWTDPSTFDTSTLSSHYAALYDGTSYRSRVARGVFDGRVTASQVLTEIGRGTASRVGVLSTGKPFFYPWGYTATAAADIPAADIIPLSWQQRDISTVVNQAVISVGRSPRFIGQDFKEPGRVDGYQYTTDFSSVNFAQVAAMTEECRAMFGNKPLGNGTFVIWPVAAGSGISTYLGNSSSEGSVLADYYLARFGKPLTYASFVVPWNRYSSLKMFDVVNFQHPEFPAFYGTDPEPPNPVITDSATSAVSRIDPNIGYEWVRAEPYRGLIEGISYVLAVEHAPAIRLTVLVLLNQPLDPT